MRITASETAPRICVKLLEESRSATIGFDRVLRRPLLVGRVSGEEPLEVILDRRQATTPHAQCLNNHHEESALDDVHRTRNYSCWVLLWLIGFPEVSYPGSPSLD